MAAFLRKAGAEVVDFDSATAAIEEYPRRRPGYIVSDLGWPKIEGHDLMQFLRAWDKDRKAARVPAWQSLPMPMKNYRKALECGFDKVLTKPIAPEQLIGALVTRAS